MATRSERLAGKVALITGGSGGIGLATARALAADGARLVVGDVASVHNAIATLASDGAEAIGVTLDVTDAASAEEAVRAALDQFGRLDVLVNNAGFGRPAPLAEVSDELWDRIVDVNLKGAFVCARAAAPHLQPGGAIVNVASLAGRASSPVMSCAYSASKAGLLGLTRHLAKELAPRGIRVVAVSPGVVETAMVAENYSDEHLKRTVAAVPLGRPARPDEIASAIAFLASPAASYVTGAALDVNGGIFMAS